MKKLMSLTFATTLGVLLLLGFPRRAAAGVEIFLTIQGIEPERSAVSISSFPVSAVVSTVWPILPL